MQVVTAKESVLEPQDHTVNAQLTTNRQIHGKYIHPRPRGTTHFAELRDCLWKSRCHICGNFVKS